VKSAWLIVSLGLVGGLVGAIYGTATWQDSGELFAPTLFGQAFVDVSVRRCRRRDDRPAHLGRSRVVANARSSWPKRPLVGGGLGA